MVFRILPPEFRAKARAEGPCGKRALPSHPLPKGRHTHFRGPISFSVGGGREGAWVGPFSAPHYRKQSCWRPQYCPIPYTAPAEDTGTVAASDRAKASFLPPSQ